MTTIDRRRREVAILTQIVEQCEHWCIELQDNIYRVQLPLKRFSASANTNSQLLGFLSQLFMYVWNRGRFLANRKAVLQRMAECKITTRDSWKICDFRADLEFNNRAGKLVE